jgi:hypothetical protein
LNRTSCAGIVWRFSNRPYGISAASCMLLQSACIA